MHRRDFFKSGVKTGVQAAMVGTAASLPIISSADPINPAPVSPSPINPVQPVTCGDAAPVLKSYTAQDHRRRLENIGFCSRAISTCMRKHLVTNYLPGQCTYNLGEYPCRKPWDPDAYDEEELDRLKNNGIQLIQVMDEWNDQMGLFGGHKLTALNPEGFHRFVSMVHKRGMKIIAYISSGYFTRTDPHYRSEWSRPGEFFHSAYWNMARCSPASPGWRAYLLPNVVRILDEFGVDGLYNDWGYVNNARKSVHQLAKDEVVAFEETPQHDGAMADLAQLVYAEVKRRGGIVKFHCDQTLCPMTGGARIYDYLWVGEGVRGLERIREETKNHEPYVVPCTQFPYVKLDNDDQPYVHAIPYMQFPLLEAGRPYTGERAMIPGVEYGPDKDKKGPVDDMTDWYRRNEAKWKYHKAHPNGPHIYSEWGPVPPSANYRSTHSRWLKKYMPLVEDGTWAWLQIDQSDLFAGPLPKDVVVSAFANRQTYLVLANYGNATADIETAEQFVPADEANAAPGKDWKLTPESIKILKRVV